VCSRLRGEHIVRVFDVGTLEGGVPYIVMEYLAGEDLKSVLQVRGPFALKVTVDYLLQACEALAEAHTHGIVHRDIKPPNLFLTRRVDGTDCIKVLDFGISKMLDLAPAPSSALDETVPSSRGIKLADGELEASQSAGTTMTRTRTAIGSPQYMAPEQIRCAR